MAPMWFDFFSVLIIPILVFFWLYEDIKKGRKIVDRSFVVGVFFFTKIYYEIDAANRSRNELLNMIIIMGIIYFATFTIYLYAAKRYEQTKKIPIEKKAS